MKEQKFIIRKNFLIAANTYEMTIEGEILEKIRGGNFLNVSIPSSPHLILKRPFGISRHTKNSLTFGYAIVGKGTEALSLAKENQEIMVTYPLGNHFECADYKNILLIGGGVGVFPLLSVASECKSRCHALLGYKNKDSVIYKNEFALLCKTCNIVTDDGSEGNSGFVTDYVCENLRSNNIDAVFICGPKGMISSCKTVLANHRNIPSLVSVEERMGCGVGACLVCACKIKTNDGVQHKRACADGPVFNLWEVE